jgi:hypothetical protein
MAKVKITGLPKAMMGAEVSKKKTQTPTPPTIQPDAREDSNVEVEKGEVILSSDPSSNQKRTATAGGKKHYEGGTPVNLPSGSAVFSDHLKLKDPSLLKVLGFSGDKPKTFAQIAKKWELSTLVDKREMPDIDQITKRSLDKSIEDSNFKLSLAFVLQQFHEKKGNEQTEHSRHFEPFLSRTGMSYEQLFDAIDEGESQLSNEPADPQIGMPEAKMGYELPKYVDAGEIIDLPPYNENKAFTPEGIQWLNTYLADYGIDRLDPNKADRDAIIAATTQAQIKAVEENPDLIFDFMTTGTDKTKSHRPNNELQDAMKKAYKEGRSTVKPSDNGNYTNADLKKMLEENKADKTKGLGAKDILEGYKDNKWWYRMVTDRQKEVTQEEYNKLKPLLEKDGITQNGITYLYTGSGIYESYKIVDGNVVKVEPDPKVLDELYKWNYKPMDDSQTPINMDYRWENKRALAQARKQRRNIPFIRPLTALPETFYTDQAYYSPDQAIAAIQSESAAQQQQRAMFAAPQQQLANQLASQSMQMMGKVISDYADKNVDAYNKERLFNTQVAQNAANTLAGKTEQHHNAYSTLKQQYANAYMNADNAVAAQEIAMHKERADRKNLEASIGEQYIIDPDTGLHVFVKGKDFYPDTTPEKTVDDIYAEIIQKHPTMDPTIAAKLAMARRSGKYTVEESDYPVNTNNYNYST